MPKRTADSASAPAAAVVIQPKKKAGEEDTHSKTKKKGRKTDIDKAGQAEQGKTTSIANLLFDVCLTFPVCICSAAMSASLFPFAFVRRLWYGNGKFYQMCIFLG